VPPAATVVYARAPIRIGDTGGWTDTWFARHGRVCSIAVSPGVEVRVVAREPRGGEGPGVVVDAETYGDRYPVPARPAPWGPHPLLEAAIASVPLPRPLRIEVRVRSGIPPGAGTGTSAAVTVALLGALDRVAGIERTPHEVAMAAYRVETEGLGRQSGVQDQLGCAHGGINDIEVTVFPAATVTRLALSADVRAELERRLLLVYLGRSHDSSALHETVIRGLENAGPDHPVLEALRAAAARSRDALRAGDFAALGAAMVDNTEAQARLHPDLVGSRARRAIALARTHGVLGFKVNGAGGDGGSITLLGPDAPARKTALVEALEAEDAGFRIIPVRLDDAGLQVSAGEGPPEDDREGGTPWTSSASEC
jgi:D-glycero-alpha-D-manno-heptose-7-phosphate kinase